MLGVFSRTLPGPICSVWGAEPSTSLSRWWVILQENQTRTWTWHNCVFMTPFHLSFDKHIDLEHSAFYNYFLLTQGSVKCRRKAVFPRKEEACMTVVVKSFALSAAGNSASPSSPRQHNAAADMQAVEVGQELRRIGDDFNNRFLRVSDHRS